MDRLSGFVSRKWRVIKAQPAAWPGSGPSRLRFMMTPRGCDEAAMKLAEIAIPHPSHANHSTNRS
jgi:hypothetical protein